MKPSPDDMVSSLDQKALLELAARQSEAKVPRGYRAPTTEELSDEFPDLDVLEMIGTGGMGCVFRAKQKKLDRIVALKILPRELASDDLFAERFAREARAMARLNHPNIVAIHDFGQAGEMYFLIMEYMDGMNLRELLETDTLDPAQALAIFTQVCNALSFAHDEGVVHRDIKPENILFNKQGHVALADFGLARLALDSNCEISLTQTRQAMGTLNYMAPEQYESPKTVDHRADIYAMGVLLYELMTGKIPRGSFPPVSTVRPDAPFVDHVINRALQVAPEDRYATLDLLVQDLKTSGDASRMNAPPADRPSVSPTVLTPANANGTFTNLVNAGKTPFRAMEKLIGVAEKKPSAPRQRWLPLHRLTYVALLATTFLLLFPWTYRSDMPAMVEHDPHDFPHALLLPILLILSQLAKYREFMNQFRWFVMTFLCFFAAFAIGAQSNGNNLQMVYLGMMFLLAVEYAIVVFNGVYSWMRQGK